MTAQPPLSLIPLAMLSLLYALASAPARAQAPSETPQPGPSRTQAATTNEQAMAAQAAQVHPIVASPEDPLRPAFQLYAELDLPILGVGVVFASSRLVLLQKAYCAPLCDASELNALDRKTAGWWRPVWRHTSNAALPVVAGGAALLMMVDEGFLDGLNDSVVIAESALAAMATVSVMTLATSRPRPFLYGEDAPLGKRNSSDAGLSFLSSHAAVSFATVTSTFMALRRLHPTSKLPYWVLGIGGALAALVATSRVLAGMHFITDALGGAVVGTSMGVLVPALHRSPVRVAGNASSDSAGLMLMGRF